MDGRGIYLWTFHVYFFLFLLLSGPSLQCGPGRGSGRRRPPRKLTPLVFKQHVPSVSENTLGASGPFESKISRTEARFKDLATNHNPDIIFKNEEGTDADRMMSHRCKDKLNTLAISVMNQWPGIKLRVTEAWDEGGQHAAKSLHYEGRGVDITTSDRDRSKYGMLARLAVEAGFDWVYYESRGHIHCSVASDSSAVVKIGGCFPGSGTVFTETEGRKFMSDLRIGERVLTMNSEGNMEFSNVLTFLDKDVSVRELFHTLHLMGGATVTLTAKHLIYAQKGNCSKDYQDASFRATFAENVHEGDYVYVVDNKSQPSRPKLSRVIKVSRKYHTGVFAPLTSTGTIVVDGVVTSCYAFIDDISLAHVAFAPMRLYHGISSYMPITLWTSTNTESESGEGIHWYAKMLYYLGQLFLSKDLLFAP